MRSILSNRLLMCLLILLICAVAGFYLLQMQQPKAPIVISKPVEVEKPKETEALVGDTSEDHFHADGTFHEGTHAAHETDDPPAVVNPDPAVAASLDYTPAMVQIPEGITDPEVLAAWQRLDDIAKNPFQWGGRQSDRALELMDALTPMWVIDDPHDHGEELMMTLDLLAAERDPRSAELLVAYQLDSEVQGTPIDEALVAMGPAAVPAVIARLNPEESNDVFLVLIIHLLPPIVEQHRETLGGIVDYILIPRLEAIAALEESTVPGYIRDNKSFARKALAHLKK